MIATPKSKVVEMRLRARREEPRECGNEQRHEAEQGRGFGEGQGATGLLDLARHANVRWLRVGVGLDYLALDRAKQVEA